MSQLNMKDLYSTINEKTLKRMEIYDDVLKKCHHRIKYNSSLERTYCFFQIPEFIIGVPLYDITEMRNYVMNSLKKNGFELLYIEPNWLFIMWNVKGYKTIAKNTTIKDNKAVSNYKSVDTYKPTGVYDDTTMMNMMSSMNSVNSGNTGNPMNSIPNSINFGTKF